MAVDAMRDMSLAAGAWMRAHQRGAAAMSSLPGILGAVLAPAPMPLCDDMKAVLVAVPSAGLDAWIASGGRHPGQSAAEALALEEALQAVHASAAALQTAARDAGLAAEALLHALRCGTAAGDGPSGSPAVGAAPSGSPPHGGTAPGTQQAEQGDTGADPLHGIPSEALLGCYRHITWGQWFAMCATTARSLALEAQLRGAVSEALLHAPPPGAGGEGELSVEMCDALAQLWRLQPHVDDALLRALVTATQGE